MRKLSGKPRKQYWKRRDFWPNITLEKTTNQPFGQNSTFPTGEVILLDYFLFANSRAMFCNVNHLGR